LSGEQRAAGIVVPPTRLKLRFAISCTIFLHAMNTLANNRITLVGAGLAGSLLAVFLARRGLDVTLYEARPDMRRVSIPAGRSINLALSARGLHALAQVGLHEAVMAQALPMRGRMIHAYTGETHLQPYGQRPDEVIYSISRGELNKVLLTAAEAHGATLHFDTACTGYDPEARTLHLHETPTRRAFTVQALRVLAADGAGSAVRIALAEAGRLECTQDFISHGYKELTIPPGPDGSFQMAPDALHIWPRGTFMLIALPNPDRTFTCTLFLPWDGTPGFNQLDTPATVQAFFDAEFPDARPLIDDLTGTFFSNPTGRLGTLYCWPWHDRDRVLLLGDAAHAIVPFFGQGMNCAFEDCTVLDTVLDTFNGDWAHGFATFAQARKAHTDAIAEMALENFIEMRDRVNDPRFVLMRDVGLELERRYPETFIPKYAMVSFHRIPYADVRQRGQAQAALLEALTEGHTTLAEIDWSHADALVEAYSTRYPPLPA
jgi:kynurenine 3-monooxygenase